MKVRSLGGGAGIVVLAWGCSSEVQIGHGDPGGQTGQGGSQNGGSGGLSPGGDSSSGGSMAGSGGSGGIAQAGTAGKGGQGGSTGFEPDPPQQSSDKLDLLFVVDNSISMADSQVLLAESVPSFLRRLENPLCLEANGTPSATQPSGPAEACPTGSEREFAPVRDMHVGVITNSLGARGGQICTDATTDDRAELMPSVRPGLNSYNGSGFLKWDPDATGAPAGESNLDLVAADLIEHIAAASFSGCGYEHTLEAWYQFLIDPEPTTNIVMINNVSTPMGVNQAVLDQRAAFLRPDSAVAIIVLTNENDCSIRNDGLGWLVGLSQSGGRPFTMPRSTQACQTDPNSPCCFSCATALPIPGGCNPPQSDPQCLINGGNLDNSSGFNEDQLNLRCYDQKRRFGLDLLFPIERYTAGLTHKMVPNRAGVMVPNPLFTTNRNPTLLSFALIAGVPWQNLSVNLNPTVDDIAYLTADELTAQGRWQLILGDPANYVRPTDPVMWEQPGERSGVSPLMSAAIVPSSTDGSSFHPANGHEQTNVDSTDLQYSCIFELPEPILCSTPECDCGPGTEARNRPLCKAPGTNVPTNTQYFGKAYPPIRPLALAKSLGKQAVLGSICSRNTADFTDPDYAYSAEFNSLARRLGIMLVD